MSFSREVKEELGRHKNEARHCRLAELAAILQICGDFGYDKDGNIYLKLETENLTVAEKSFMLVRCTFGIQIDVSVRRNALGRKNTVYFWRVTERKDVEKILKATKLLDETGAVWGGDRGVHRLLVQNTCCKRAYIRGAFMAAGSVTDPNKAYHFEVALTDMGQAMDLQRVVRSFEIDAKIVRRKKYYVLYVKEGDQIVEMLGVMEAHVALMHLENVRILKEVRNSVNRQVNCETANINKTVTAATKQIEDIKYVRDAMGFGKLTDALRQIAELRLEHPEVSLQELGGMLDKPIGKSGANHRLRKISEIADKLRNQKEDLIK